MTEFEHYFLTDRKLERSGKYSSKSSGLGSLNFGKIRKEAGRPLNFISLPSYRQLFEELEEKFLQGYELLIFVHGYSHSFNKLLGSAERLHRLYGGDKFVILVYSWPSLGLPAFYAADRKAAEESARNFAIFLADLKNYAKTARSESRFLERINLVAVSMGNYLLDLALKELLLDSNALADALLDASDKIASGQSAFERSGSKKVFNEIVHMAADLDENSEQLYSLDSGFARRVHIYGNKTDVLLSISTGIHRRKRLGLRPDPLHFGEYLSKSRNPLKPDETDLHLVDTTAVSIRQFFTASTLSIEELSYSTLHNYMFRVEPVIQDLRKVLQHQPFQADFRRLTY